MEESCWRYCFLYVVAELLVSSEGFAKAAHLHDPLRKSPSAGVTNSHPAAVRLHPTESHTRRKRDSGQARTRNRGSITLATRCGKVGSGSCAGKGLGDDVMVMMSPKPEAESGAKR